MATSLDDILSDKEPTKPEAEALAEEPKGEATDKPEIERATSRRAEHRKREFSAQGRDPDTGQFVTKDEAKPETKVAEVPAADKPTDAAKTVEKQADKPAAPTQPEYTERERAFLRGLEEERRKRQELERKLGEKPAEEKKFWDDPDGVLKSHEQRLREIAVQTKLSTTEAIARSKYTDFDDKIAAFGELMQQTPGLAQQWLASVDPAEYAYKTGKNHIELRQAGNLDALREKIVKETEAKVRVQIEAEFKAKQEALERDRAALTPSLSDVRGAAPQSRAVFTGPTPMNDILSGTRKH